MFDDHPRVTFRLDDATLAQAQQLAQRHNQSLSALCRDSLTLLLSDPAPYFALLSARLLQHSKPPTPEQEAAFAEYLATYDGPDIDAILASMPPPPEL
jgi:hypothetical protein